MWRRGSLPELHRQSWQRDARLWPLHSACRVWCPLGPVRRWARGRGAAL